MFPSKRQTRHHLMIVCNVNERGLALSDLKRVTVSSELEHQSNETVDESPTLKGSEEAPVDTGWR